VASRPRAEALSAGFASFPMSDLQLQQARQHHLRGDFARAIAVYDEMLAANPALAEVWHLKGMALHQSGQLPQAQASAARAIEAGGERPAFLLLEGCILHDRGDFPAAEDRFSRVIAAKPDWVAGHVEMGRLHIDQGRAAEALKDYQAAVTIDAGNVRAWNGVGVALQSLDRLDEAVRAFNHALTIDGRFAMAHFNLARIYNLRSDTPRALVHAQSAVRHDPGHVEAWLLIGDIHRRKREMPQALGAYSSAARAEPSNLKARGALAGLVAEAGRFEDARAEYRRMAQQFPASLEAALGANLLLPQVYSSVEELERIRAEYGEGLQRLQAHAPAFRGARAAEALNHARWTNFYLAYQGRDDRDLQTRYGDFLRSVLAPAAPEFFAPRSRRAGGGRIRVGFLSHFFFNCTAGRYFSSWITHLDPKRFETFVYYTNEWVADDTRAIAAAAGTFRHLPGRPLYTLAQEVAGDALDILVYPELGMHSGTFTLASLRLAPVQCAGWGHPNTTGLEEIDWFISCEAMEPENAERHYRERLALLPGLGTRYAVQQPQPQGTRGDFGLPEDRTLYLVPQSLFKIHPDNDALIAEVLARDPDGVAVMFASHHEHLTEVFATRLARALQQRGIDIHERVCFLAPFVPHPAYLRLNQLCDVMLDTVHWSGGNTSLDALANGLPVVTHPGPLMRGRQSHAMLRILGAPELIAEDFEAHVETAVRLGRDPEERRALSERIRGNRSALFERDEPVRALERFLEKAATSG
jgi:CRISPR-associated protein Csy1